MSQPCAWHGLPSNSRFLPGFPVLTGSAPSPGPICPSACLSHCVSVSPLGAYVCLCSGLYFCA